MPDSDIILPDTSCLIFLGKIGELTILKNLYNRTIVTQEVAVEHIDPLPEWIEIQAPNEIRYQKVLEQTVERGGKLNGSCVGTPGLCCFYR